MENHHLSPLSNYHAIVDLRAEEELQANCSICYNLMVEPCNLEPYCKHKYCI